MATLIPHTLWREEPIVVLQPGRHEELIAGPVILSEVVGEESVILTPSLFNSQASLVRTERLQLINCLQIALLT